MTRKSNIIWTNNTQWENRENTALFLDKLENAFFKFAPKFFKLALSFKKFEPQYLDETLALPHFKFFFDDCFCGIVNLVDNIPYYTFMIWDESNKNHSYGILSYYYLINKFYNEGLKYVYISEFYEQFSYKHTLPGFEYWTGTNWTSEYLS